MPNEMSDAAEHIRQHVHKVLAQLRALKEQSRGKLDPVKPDIAVEIDREEDTPSSVNGGEGPP